MVAGLQLRKQHDITSVLSLSLSPMAYITRLTKTSMLDALGQDYIRTAKAKGVHQYKIIFVHALRNALIPGHHICGTYGLVVSSQVQWLLRVFSISEDSVPSS